MFRSEFKAIQFETFNRFMLRTIASRTNQPLCRASRAATTCTTAAAASLYTATRNAGWFSGLFSSRGGGNKSSRAATEQRQQQQHQQQRSSSGEEFLMDRQVGQQNHSSSSPIGKLEEPPEAPTAHALCAAAADGSLERVKDLMARGAPSNIAATAVGLTAMHAAAMAGHVDVCEFMLNAPRPASPLITVTHQCITPLHVACAHDRVEVVKLLCRKVRALGLRPFTDQFDRNAVHSAIDIRANDEKVTPLHLAVKFSSPEIVEELLKTGANPTLFTNEPEPQSPISVACMRGDLKLLKLLFTYAYKIPGMSEKAVVELASPKSGTTPLQMAAGAGQVEILKFLVEECNADVKHVSELCPHPALYLAAYGGHTETVRYLLQNCGLKPDEQLVGDGASPLHAACQNGSTATVKLLLDAGADKLLRRKDSGLVPAHVACMYGHLEVVKMLFPPATPLPPLPLAEKNNFTTLHFAIFGGPHVDVLAYLLSVGFESEVGVLADERRVTPLHLAAEAGSAECVRLLLPYCKNEALVNARDTLGITALHCAAHSGSMECVKMLIEAGADMSIADRSGQTPIVIAKDAKHLQIMEYLQRHATATNAAL